MGLSWLLEDIQSGGDLIPVTLADRYLVAKQVDRIAADIVDLGDIDDVGSVDLQEVGTDEFLFHILQRAIGDIIPGGGNEFHIVAHAFEEEDVILFQFDQFVFRLNEEEIRIGGRGGSGSLRKLCRRDLLLEFVDRLLEAFERERLFQVVVDMVLESVESVLRFGGGEDDFWGIGQPVEQIETAGTGHFDVQKQQVHLLLIEVFERVRYVEEMPFHVDEVALLTEFTKKVCGNLDIFYYYTRKLHPKTIRTENRLNHPPRYTPPTCYTLFL